MIIDEGDLRFVIWVWVKGDWVKKKLEPSKLFRNLVNRNLPPRGSGFDYGSPGTGTGGSESGTLRIDVEDAKEADLSAKRDIKVLLLQWSIYDVRNEEMGTRRRDLRNKEMEKQVTMKGYGVDMTPVRSYLVLKLSALKNPRLLQYFLAINWATTFTKGTCYQQNELYKEGGCSRPFPSMETLYFETMKEWEKWISHGVGQQVEGFPRLPEHPPSLKRLVIKSCRELLISVASFPVGCRFEIDGCKQVQPRTDIYLGSLNPMSIADFQELVSFPEATLPSLLRAIDIESCKALECLPNTWMDSTSLECFVCSIL
ncbi:hypothetical protein Dsin_032380 [Dipteronia sinensis]|uniref:Uncharacterized protein n=1 Tax=Dipteronia sinensis TaxID=43782 RepID=A0AAD9ZPK9_9ROSI|nr:hypothetical protein Dsin_032380 [Dipteronia sinensis]